MNNNSTVQLGRRAFLVQGSLVLGAMTHPWTLPRLLSAEESTRKLGVKFGLVTDLHYADKPAAGTRFYRETLKKLAEAAGQFEKDQPEFLVELGDLIDAADSVKTELAYLKRINKEFAGICKNRHYVLGNHCVDTLSKEEFLGEVGQPNSYYSFNQGGIHFVVLDACFREDGKPYQRKNFTWTDSNIVKEELAWLKDDLKANKLKTVVFVHQRLDVDNTYGIKNAGDVRKVFEDSGNVLAVFQGHSHKNDYREISGIHYCTMVAMIEGSEAENNGYSTVTVGTDGTINITGFRKQKSYEWSAKR